MTCLRLSIHSLNAFTSARFSGYYVDRARTTGQHFFEEHNHSRYDKGNVDIVNTEGIVQDVPDSRADSRYDEADIGTTRAVEEGQVETEDSDDRNGQAQGPRKEGKFQDFRNAEDEEQGQEADDD